MKLSTYFTLNEFVSSQTATRRGINNTPTESAMINLQFTALKMDDIRRLLNKPILISSGYRCAELNTAICGSKTSSHVRGEAVDFTSPGFGSNALIFGEIENSGIKFDQLILEYPNSPNGGWVHVSFGGKQRGQCLIFDGKKYKEVGR